jgi:hypothetical protein
MVKCTGGRLPGRGDKKVGLIVEWGQSFSIGCLKILEMDKF